eukprot:1138763-Pelagomonas_calceolata.AAC.7
MGKILSCRDSVQKPPAHFFLVAVQESPRGHTSVGECGHIFTCLVLCWWPCTIGAAIYCSVPRRGHTLHATNSQRCCPIKPIPLLVECVLRVASEAGVTEATAKHVLMHMLLCARAFVMLTLAKDFENAGLPRDAADKLAERITELIVMNRIKMEETFVTNAYMEKLAVSRKLALRQICLSIQVTCCCHGNLAQCYYVVMPSLSYHGNLAKWHFAVLLSPSLWANWRAPLWSCMCLHNQVALMQESKVMGFKTELLKAQVGGWVVEAAAKAANLWQSFQKQQIRSAKPIGMLCFYWQGSAELEVQAGDTQGVC